MNNRLRERLRANSYYEGMLHLHLVAVSNVSTNAELTRELGQRVCSSKEQLCNGGAAAGLLVQPPRLVRGCLHGVMQSQERQRRRGGVPN